MIGRHEHVVMIKWAAEIKVVVATKEVAMAKAVVDVRIVISEAAPWFISVPVAWAMLTKGARFVESSHDGRHNEEHDECSHDFCPAACQPWR